LEFANDWLWLIFVGAGLFLAVLELLVGVDTGLDMVIVGSVFVISGLATWPFGSWAVTIVVVSAVSIMYVVGGRKYVHRRMLVKGEKTNIDTIIGRKGSVQKEISASNDGLVKVGYEEWRARSGEAISEGQDVVVTGIEGVTLTVKKSNGGK